MLVTSLSFQGSRRLSADSAESAHENQFASAFRAKPSVGLFLLVLSGLSAAFCPAGPEQLSGRGEQAPVGRTQQTIIAIMPISALSLLCRVPDYAVWLRGRPKGGPLGYIICGIIRVTPERRAACGLGYTELVWSRSEWCVRVLSPSYGSQREGRFRLFQLTRARARVR